MPAFILIYQREKKNNKKVNEFPTTYNTSCQKEQKKQKEKTK
jgi:hypothetical protein